MEEPKYCYQYPHPAVTADCVVFRYEDNKLNVLLIERGGEPYKGCWAFPGGFMNIDETAEQAALRELEEETGMVGVTGLTQIGAFTTVDRDPRERVITVAFYAFTDQSEVQGGDDAAQAKWFPVDALPPLAFDHDAILCKALVQFKNDVRFRQ